LHDYRSYSSANAHHFLFTVNLLSTSAPSRIITRFAAFFIPNIVIAFAVVLAVLASSVAPAASQISSQAASELIPYRKGTQWGFCDHTKKVKIPIKYDNASRFIAGLARVQIGGQWGCVNPAGQEVIPLQYEWLESFEQGVAFVKRGGKWGAVDANGKERIVPAFDELRTIALTSTTTSTPQFAAKRDGKWGVVSLAGTELLAPKYDNIAPPFRGFAQVRLGGKIGVVSALAGDSVWKEIVAPIYDQVSGFASGSGVGSGGSSNAYASVEQENKFGLVNAQWMLVVPVKYDNVSTVSEGLVAVQLLGKWGFVSITGSAGAGASKEAIQLIYDKVSDFSGGYARVQRGGKWGFIATDGVEYWEE
jgi:hypothetical protein